MKAKYLSSLDGASDLAIACAAAAEIVREDHADEVAIVMVQAYTPNDPDMAAHTAILGDFTNATLVAFLDKMIPALFELRQNAARDAGLPEWPKPKDN
jgi:hypothetical protein